MDAEALIAIQERKHLLVELDLASTQYAKHKKQIAILQSSSKIDRLAVRNNQNVLAELQAELSETRQELAFYQRVVSPATKTDGLVIQDFRILKDSEYQYRLALYRGTVMKGVVRGIVRISFKGNSENDGNQIIWRGITEGEKEGLKFKFRHFQLLTGSFSFPKGFTPESVELEVIPLTKGIKKFTKVWRWTKLMEMNT